MGIDKRLLAGVAAALAVLVVAGVVLVRWAADRTTVHTIDGLSVEAPAGVDVALTRAEPPTELPGLPFMTPVGTFTDVAAGELPDGRHARLTLSYPDTLSAEEVDALYALRHDGERWHPLPPISVDTRERTVTVATLVFSTWGLGTWRFRERLDAFVDEVANQFSSDGIFSAIGGLTATPPTEHCPVLPLTLLVDTSEFVDDAIVCTRFRREDESRQTYDLFLSNTKGFPVELTLPDGVTYQEVRPAPSNAYSRMIRLARMLHTGNRTVVLPGGGMLKLQVDAAKLPHVDQGRAAVQGRLDVVTPVLELATAALQLATPLEPDDEVVRTIAEAQQMMDVVGCVADAAQQFVEKGERTLKALEGWFIATLATCSPAVEALAKVFGEALTDYVYRKLRPEAFPELLQNAGRFVNVFNRVKVLWENAHVVTQVAAFMREALTNGPVGYRLSLARHDPPLNLLDRVLPPPGTEMYLVEPDLQEFYAVERRYGTAARWPAIGHACQDQLPVRWQDSYVDRTDRRQLYLLANQSRTDGRMNDVSTRAYVAHVPPEQRDTVKSFFTNLLGVTRCTHTEDRSRTDATAFDVGEWPALAVGFHTRWSPYASEPSEGSMVAAYDERGYVVVLEAHRGSIFTDSYNQPEVSEEQMAAALRDALGYLGHRADAMLGTRFAPN
ncbi:hypothetical protein [Polymorphospora rubra]|uniref:hypothetical protein n=1 Tax=Polymorphospora rubra TaxID=338584 RepID=UPI0033F2485D